MCLSCITQIVIKHLITSLDSSGEKQFLTSSILRIYHSHLAVLAQNLHWLFFQAPIPFQPIPLSTPLLYSSFTDFKHIPVLLRVNLYLPFSLGYLFPIPLLNLTILISEISINMNLHTMFNTILKKEEFYIICRLHHSPFLTVI